MIIDKIVKNTWNSNNKKYYIDKGYIFTKMYEEFDVKIEDLYYGSNKVINVKCDVCEKEKMIEYRKYIKNINNCNYYSCSQKCSHSKNKKTNLERYDDENYNNRKKYKKTCLKNFGVENPSQNKKIKNKKVETCLKNFGVKYPIQSKKVQEKIRITCLKKYGYEYSWLNIDVKKKVNDTILKKYGVENAAQNKDIMNKIIQTQIDRYGELWKNHIPRYNPNSIIYLDMISEKINIHIQHALNGGEKKLLKYWIDGYIEQYNICIEWDEKEHDSIKDYIREKYLIVQKGCRFIRIDEEQFLKNIEFSISNIVNKINELIKCVF